uniref:Cytoskeleton-associated protein 2 C-terminal domain-containing protein n=1 Tax=Malurus cyaneus samueli TaxID=2593467 RepID=A0A8C5U587_9PASS
MEGAQGSGNLRAKSTQHAGHTAQQKPSNTSQRAAGMHPVQPGKKAKLPAPAQSTGRLPSSSSGHLNPERNQKSAQETVTAAIPQVGSDHPPPGAPCSLNEGLQDRLVCHKENLDPHGSTRPELIRTLQSDGSSLGKKKVLAHRQSSAIMSRPILGPKDKISNRQAKEEAVPDKFRKMLPDSKSVSQKTSVRTHLLQHSQFPPASANLLHKNPGINRGKTTTVRQPVGKPPGTAPERSLKHHSQPLPVRRFPTKPPTLDKPQGTTNLKSSLKPSVTLPRPRPMVKEGMDRKNTKVVPPGHTAASQGTGHPNQSRSIHNSKTRGLGMMLGGTLCSSPTDSVSRRPVFASRLTLDSVFLSQPRARCGCVSEIDILILFEQGKLAKGGFQGKSASSCQLLSAGVVTVISWLLDRKQLEEWLASKGKKYKRPPMMLLQKQEVKPSCRKVKAKEKQENPEQRYQMKINNILTECLKLVEEGVQAEELSAVLSLVPQPEKFAKFWICQAKLLARNGPFDVLQLYREAVSAGAEPVEELRETALNMLKDAGQTLEGNLSTVGWAGCSMGGVWGGRELLEGPELKFLTPVRRSLRIERAGSYYPQMLKDHDPVVSSLSEILDAEEETCFFFRKNKALPEVTELEGLSSYPPSQGLLSGSQQGQAACPPCCLIEAPLTPLAAPQMEGGGDGTQ